MGHEPIGFTLRAGSPALRGAVMFSLIGGRVRLFCLSHPRLIFNSSEFWRPRCATARLKRNSETRNRQWKPRSLPHRCAARPQCAIRLLYAPTTGRNRSPVQSNARESLKPISPRFSSPAVALYSPFHEAFSPLSEQKKPPD